nr:immunoglobulin heavy chain junction region [Macaca mulatta]
CARRQWGYFDFW